MRISGGPGRNRTRVVTRHDDVITGSPAVDVVSGDRRGHSDRCDRCRASSDCRGGSAIFWIVDSEDCFGGRLHVISV